MISGRRRNGLAQTNMNRQKAEFTAPVIVPHDHPSLADHFPSRPLAPGALILDLVTAAYLERFPQKRLVEIIHAKFLKPVTPAAVCTLTVTRTRGDRLVFDLRDAGDKLLMNAAMRFEKL